MKFEECERSMNLERMRGMKNMKRMRKGEGIAAAATTPCLQQPNRAAPSKAKINKILGRFTAAMGKRCPTREGWPPLCMPRRVPASLLLARFSEYQFLSKTGSAKTIHILQSSRHIVLRRATVDRVSSRVNMCLPCHFWSQCLRTESAVRP